MSALIVYESMYGNTAAVAHAIGEGLVSHGVAAVVVEVSDASVEDAMASDLLVVGGPTHAHGMTRTTTRTTAIEDKKNAYDHPTVGPGLREWLDRLPDAKGHRAAAFDTRIHGPAALTGAASKGIAHRLTERGFHLVADRVSFLVSKDNTLRDGELEAASAWGATLAATRAAV
ncbi:MAG TPA: flavodoxin domain-containing protein [Actinomycetota bacterium]